MLEAQITATEDLIARCWKTLRNRSIPEEQRVSGAQIEGWRTSAQVLIAQMFGSGSEQSKRFEELYTVRRSEILNYLDSQREPNWDIRYWIDYFELCKSFFLEIDTSYKIANATHPNIDIGKLADELAQLHQALKSEPAPDKNEGDQGVAVGAVRFAENEARKGDGPAALAALKNAGKWALSVAEKIGVGVATDAIKAALGL